MNKKDELKNKNFISDGRDVEYSSELADQDDLEAKERADEADERAKKNQ